VAQWLARDRSFATLRRHDKADPVAPGDRHAQSAADAKPIFHDLIQPQRFGGFVMLRVSHAAD
jgi:hypothetical protein